MALIKPLVGSAAMLALTGAVNAATTPLFGSLETYAESFVGDPNAVFVDGFLIDSAVFESTPLVPGVSNNASLTITWDDVTYASLDDSGNPFAPGTAPEYISTIQTVFTGTTDVNGSLLLSVEPTVFSIVGCADIDPGACDVGLPGSSANDLIGFTQQAFSTPGWEVGATLDFVSGVAITAYLDFHFVVARYEFVLSDTAPVPVPASVWFFGSGLMGLAALNRRRNSKN